MSSENAPDNDAELMALAEIAATLSMIEEQYEPADDFWF